MHPLDRIPELAGLATYRDAAHIGFSVDENVARMLLLAWAERRLMMILVAHLPATPVWEVKCAMALFHGSSAEHADELRHRIGEMRHPVPPLDCPPNDPFNEFLDELLRSSDVARAAGRHVCRGVPGHSSTPTAVTSRQATPWSIIRPGA